MPSTGAEELFGTVHTPRTILTYDHSCMVSGKAQGGRDSSDPGEALSGRAPHTVPGTGQDAFSLIQPTGDPEASVK